MNVLSFMKVLESVVSAFVYGIVFSFLRSFAGIIFLVIKILYTHSISSHKKSLNHQKTTSFGIFISVVLFGLGFSIISYVFVDGCIRMYLLLFSLLGMYLSNITIVRFLNNIVLLSMTKTLNIIFLCIQKLKSCITKFKFHLKKSKN